MVQWKLFMLGNSGCLSDSFTFHAVCSAGVRLSFVFPPASVVFISCVQCDRIKCHRPSKLPWRLPTNSPNFLSWINHGIWNHDASEIFPGSFESQCPCRMKTILDVRPLILFVMIFLSRSVLSVKFCYIKAMLIINADRWLSVFVLGDYIDQLAHTVAGHTIAVIRTPCRYEEWYGKFVFLSFTIYIICSCHPQL
jgi:hypothetical protein